MKVLVASTNPGKISEISQILSHEDIVIISPQEAGLKLEVPEDGATFEDNAVTKALAWYRAGRIPSLADDSGLCVDALDGRPGVHTARFAGEKATDRDNYGLLLKLMEGVTDRKAHFVCTVALAVSEDVVITATGQCDGVILHEPMGEGGFGYDPIFLDEASGRSFAQLSDEEKNARSHRSRALVALRHKLEERGIIGRG